MTCIVAIAEAGSVWMGGDRAAVENGHYLTHSAAPKVFRRGPLLIGYTSSFRMGQLLQYRLEVPPLPFLVSPSPDALDEWMATVFVDAVRACLKDGGYTKITDAREEVGIFLVGVAGSIFMFDDDYNVRRPACGFEACGSGVSVALGSLFSTGQMDPPRRLRLALEAAAQLVTTVRGPFDILHSGGTAE